MTNPNYTRSSELKTFLGSLEQFCSSKSKLPFTVFMVVIENLPMLNIAYGHAKADKLIARLCEKISADIGEAHRILDGNIAIILPGANAEKNRVAVRNLKKLV